MRPVFRIWADDVEITAAVKDRLLSLTYTDDAEDKSDRLALRLDDRPREGAPVALPAIGTVLRLALGYVETGVIDMGSFSVDEWEVSGPPAVLSVSAKAAAMATSFRTPATRSWPDTTLGGIVETVAREHGYAPVINEALGAVPIPHEDQTAESPMAFLTRLASRHDAVAKPLDGRLILAPRGEAKAASGKSLPNYTIIPADVAEWSYKYNARKQDGEAGDEEKGGATVVYWDKDEAKMKEAASGKPPYTNVRFASSDGKSAASSATAADNKGKRAKDTFTCKMTGRPILQAEQQLVLAGFRHGVPTEWRVKSVVHTLDGGGYSVAVTAELYRADQKTAADAAEKAKG